MGHDSLQRFRVRRSFWLALSLVAVVALSRWPLTPRYLYFFDSINFALALEEFDPSQHRPQPPGYPLFVAFTRALRWLTITSEQTLILAGILISALGLFLAWKVGKEIFSARAGLIAALLLVLNPAFWLAGITNQVRTCLAAGTCAVALLAWRAAEPGAPKKWFYAAAAALGVAAGFRPDLLLFLTLLLVWVGLRGRRPLRQWLSAALFLAVTAGPWLGYTILVTGGPKQFFGVLGEYASTQFSASSLLLGADAGSAWRMVKAAIIWNSLGVLTWVWVLPFVRPRLVPPALRRAAPFLLVWFLPAFLFHAFIHVGDPDHTLVTVPILCLVGGALLSELPERSPASHRRRQAWAVAAAVTLNAVVFFRPLPGIAKACSYRAARSLDLTVTAVFNSIRELRRARPIVFVSYRSLATWRHLYYYFPGVPLFVLNTHPQQNPDASTVWLLRNRQGAPLLVLDGEIILPANRRVIWLVQPQHGLHKLLARTAPVQRHGPVVYQDNKPGMHFQFGGYRFATLPMPAANPLRSTSASIQD